MLLNKCILLETELVGTLVQVIHKKNISLLNLDSLY